MNKARWEMNKHLQNQDHKDTHYSKYCLDMEIKEWLEKKEKYLNLKSLDYRHEYIN